jgi:hypothetical protein
MVYKTRLLDLIMALMVAGSMLTTLIWMFAVGSAEGVSCDVPSGSYTTIQNAVDDNVCDTINLTAELYVENVVVSRSVAIQGQGAFSTSVDGSSSGSVFVIRAGYAVTLSDFAIDNGRAIIGGGILNEGSGVVVNGCAITNNGANQGGGGIYNTSGGITTIISCTLSFNDDDNKGGGAIYNQGGVLNIYESTFISNTLCCSGSKEGGAIYNAGGLVTLDNSTLSGNSAESRGGGIYNAGGFVTLDNSVLSDNSLEGGGLTLGGGVYHASGTMTITDSVIANNSGDRGGGIFVANGQLMISATVLYENNADIGGGILKAQGKIEIVNSDFVSNSATFGGGIANEPGGAIYVAGSTLRGNAARGNGGGIANIGSVDIVNSTLSGNSANWGGGIENRESNISPAAGILTITNSTLSGNMADNGGAIYNWNEASATLANSIIANSSGGGCAGPGAFVSSGHNIDSGVTCNLTAGGDLTGTDPMLGPLGDNGGATWTHALLPGSPAINAGDNAVCAAPPANGVDQRGIDRPKGVACDIGAFEVELPFATLLPLVLR